LHTNTLYIYTHTHTYILTYTCAYTHMYKEKCIFETRWKRGWVMAGNCIAFDFRENEMHVEIPG